MSERFEDISRALARPMARRGALRMVGATLAAGVAAVVVKPMTADAAVCTSGQTVCGRKCCDAGSACTKPGCCCPRGTASCGNKCCAHGVGCVDARHSICGCQPGTTPCGTGRNLRCCPAGSSCQRGCPRPRNNVAKHC